MYYIILYYHFFTYYFKIKYHEIFKNSIFLAYVPKKNILIAPWLQACTLSLRCIISYKYEIEGKGKSESILIGL